MDLLLERSTWSDGPVPPDVAFAFHADGLARWLRVAGAEPRLALALCSGRGAAEALSAALTARGVEVVHAPATARAPVHADLAAHQGDHFNNRLFWVDGFDGDDGGALAGLDARTVDLRRMATWVLVVIESPRALVHLERRAPRLKAAFDRRCLALDAGVGAWPEGEVDAAVAAVLPEWRERQRVPELVYATATSPLSAPTYDDFSRLVRSGYAALHLDRDVHPERRRLLDVWQGLDVVDPGPAAAEALLRHGRGDRAALAALLAAPARYAGGMAVDDAPLLAGLARLRDAPEEGAPPIEVDRLRARAGVADVGPHLRVYVELAIAAAAAATEDVATCEDALRAAISRVRSSTPLAPELVFEVEEKAAQLHALLHRRGPAREALDRLEDAARRTASPFYAGRLALARAEYTAPLDPPKAREWFAQARQLFETHRYASWAAQARQGEG